MNFVDVIKKSVVSQFTGTISVQSIILSLLTSFIISLFIIFIYKKTYSGVIYSKGFSLSVIMLALVTTLIIQTISSNITLSLGMVGALSIVRFRTAVKEPMDTGFMFWAITAGIMSGANLYLPSLIGSLLLGLLFYIAYIMGFKTNPKYLVILKYDSNIDESIEKYIKSLPKYKLKSKSITKGIIELTFEMELNDKTRKIIDKLGEVEGMKSSSLISYQNDFGA